MYPIVTNGGELPSLAITPISEATRMAYTRIGRIISVAPFGLEAENAGHDIFPIGTVGSNSLAPIGVAVNFPTDIVSYFVGDGLAKINRKVFDGKRLVYPNALRPVLAGGAVLTPASAFQVKLNSNGFQGYPEKVFCDFDALRDFSADFSL